LTGGFLQLRTGARSAAKSAAFGGVLLAMIEGLGILLTRMTAPPPAPPMLDVPPVAAPAPGPAVVPAVDLGGGGGGGGGGAEASGSSGSGGGWFGWFGGGSGGGGGGGGEAASGGAPSGDLGNDRFAPPPMPSELQGGGEGGLR